MEECDSLQGFHLLADAGDGFGGLASCIAEELADQFSQKGQVSFMTSPDSIPFSQVLSADTTLFQTGFFSTFFSLHFRLLGSIQLYLVMRCVWMDYVAALL